MAYLEFVPDLILDKIRYKIINQSGEVLGRLEKVRVGRWMSWCLFLNDGCYLSASCIDEVRGYVKWLNSNNGKTHGELHD